jgi:RecA/RadA recombinase
MESNGKTALALSLAALAQQDGATIHWGDFESSFDPEWAAKRGLDPTKVMVFQPYVGKFDGEKEARLCTAQEQCQEIEASVAQRKTQKQVIVVDSLTSMLVEGEASAGLTGRNLKSAMSHPVFLGGLLRRWVGLSQSYSALIILINQLRQNPMNRFGDPWYTPGGNAPRFYSHIRVKLHRTKGGRILQGGKLIGIQGIMTCKKNKVGGTEGAQVGYKMLFDGPVEFLPAKDLKKDSDDE